MDLIPEPLVANSYGDEPNSHCRYRHQDDDYWHCLCAGQGKRLEAPTTFEEFLQWVSDPEKVQDWYDKYKFNVILADCFCGQGGKEYYAFGHQTDHYKFERDKGDLIEVVAERNHAFYIEPDGRLQLINFDTDYYQLYRIRNNKKELIK